MANTSERQYTAQMLPNPVLGGPLDQVDWSDTVGEQWKTTTTTDGGYDSGTILPGLRETIPQPVVLEDLGPVPTIEDILTAQIPAVDTQGVDLDEYVRISKELGFTPNGITDLKLGMFLQQQEIPVYDNAKVSSYLREWVEREHGPNDVGGGALGGMQHYWVWRPIASPIASDGREPIVVSRTLSMVSDGDVVPGLYNKHVPIEALKVARQIKVGSPCEVEFFVSDYQAVRPDPFLMVRALGGEKQYVVVHWDEPGFSLAPKKGD